LQKRVDIAAETFPKIFVQLHSHFPMNVNTLFDELLQQKLMLFAVCWCSKEQNMCQDCCRQDTSFYDVENIEFSMNTPIGK